MCANCIYFHVFSCKARMQGTCTCMMTTHVHMSLLLSKFLCLLVWPPTKHERLCNTNPFTCSQPCLKSNKQPPVLRHPTCTDLIYINPPWPEHLFKHLMNDTTLAELDKRCPTWMSKYTFTRNNVLCDWSGSLAGQDIQYHSCIYPLYYMYMWHTSYRRALWCFGGVAAALIWTITGN